MKIDIAAGQITSPSRFQITVNTWILTKATAVDVFFLVVYSPRLYHPLTLLTARPYLVEDVITSQQLRDFHPIIRLSVECYISLFRFLAFNLIVSGYIISLKFQNT